METAIASIICALIAALGGAYGASRASNKQLTVLAVRFDEFIKALDETKAELKKLGELLTGVRVDITAIETRIDALEKRIEKLEADAK